MFHYRSSEYRRLFDRLTDEAMDIAWGEHRIVLLFARHVYKFPLTLKGFEANRREARWSEEQGKTGLEPPIADCHIDRLDGLEVLWMEYVEPMTEMVRLPDWATDVDDIQVGYDIDDRLVAYDL